MLIFIEVPRRGGFLKHMSKSEVAVTVTLMWRWCLYRPDADQLAGVCVRGGPQCTAESEDVWLASAGVSVLHSPARGRRAAPTGGQGRASVRGSLPGMLCRPIKTHFKSLTETSISNLWFWIVHIGQPGQHCMLYRSVPSSLNPLHTTNRFLLNWIYSVILYIYILKILSLFNTGCFSQCHLTPGLGCLTVRFYLLFWSKKIVKLVVQSSAVKQEDF